MSALPTPRVGPGWCQLGPKVDEPIAEACAEMKRVARFDRQTGELTISDAGTTVIYARHITRAIYECIVADIDASRAADEQGAA